MTLRLTASALQGNFDEAFKAKYGVIAKAARAALERGGERLKNEGRSAIAAGGFSSKWQNAWRVNIYPRSNRNTADGAIWAYHKIRYAGIFETGATIQGKPYLWLPTKNAPPRIGGKKVTPALFSKAVAPLRSVKGKKYPLLVANYQRRGRRRKGGPAAVVIFVGIPIVRIGRKFNIDGIAARVRASMPQLYYNNLVDK